MNNPILKFYFQPPFSGWMVTSIYQQLFNYYNSIYPNLIIADNFSIHYNSNYGHRSGPHHLIIENIHSGFYKVVTYWDTAFDVTYDYGGWENNKCRGVYSSVNALSHNNIIPASYCSYNIIHENTINSIDTNFLKKYDNSLCFRGYLYAARFLLNETLAGKTNRYNIKFYTSLLSYQDYIKELNSHKIGLSLNGAAEICNRDIEILGVGSVLLRPQLVTTYFNDPLVPNFHYIPFDITDDTGFQLDIIAEKLNFLLKDEEYMRYVASNGKEWYNKNGCLQGNVNILTKILNIEELF